MIVVLINETVKKHLLKQAKEYNQITSDCIGKGLIETGAEFFEYSGNFSLAARHYGYSGQYRKAAGLYERVEKYHEAGKFYYGAGNFPFETKVKEMDKEIAANREATQKIVGFQKDYAVKNREYSDVLQRHNLS